MPFPSVRACGLNLFEGASSHAGIYSYCYALCAATLCPPDQVSAPHCAVVIAQLGQESKVVVCPNGLKIVLPSTRVARDRCASEGREKCSC